ncbi:MAG: SRPBCC family protein [Longimicrobiales bacterium]
METRTHTHEEVFPARPEQVFGLLHTPSAIRAWWGASSAIVQPKAGGIWAATWGEDEDDPEYVTSATLEVFDPPHRMVFSDYRYSARSGPLPFDADFETEFTVEAHPEGAVLRVSQAGFPCTPEGDDFYAACEKGWRDTFGGIRRYLESRRG